jgi:hypothetical protein
VGNRQRPAGVGDRTAADAPVDGVVATSFGRLCGGVVAISMAIASTEGNLPVWSPDPDGRNTGLGCLCEQIGSYGSISRRIVGSTTIHPNIHTESWVPGG